MGQEGVWFRWEHGYAGSMLAPGWVCWDRLWDVNAGASLLCFTCPLPQKAGRDRGGSDESRVVGRRAALALGQAAPGGLGIHQGGSTNPVATAALQGAEFTHPEALGERSSRLVAKSHDLQHI